MSRETLQHLNTNVLIGQTDQRGTAWHYRAEVQDEEPNHYDGAIPVEEVQRRLFNWSADSRAIAVQVPASLENMTHLDDEGRPARWETVADRQAIVRSDNGHVMGIFSDGYERHQYTEWLLTSVANILDDDLTISSAGLLRQGAIAWVEVSVPESVRTRQGVEFRPNLLATTSFDGSIATTFKRTITATVCDNTRDLALGEAGQQLKVKHSRNSRLRLAEAKDALAIVHSVAEAFAAEVAQLCAVEVSAGQWRRFLDRLTPTVDTMGKPLEGRALTSAVQKLDALGRLYTRDDRVSPWAGTAYGVIQAVNTFEHHEGIVRGSTRSERNMLKTVRGDFASCDRSTWGLLQEVLAI
jgi:phage/plasmid-like protein (TIGR03299 family)